MEEVSMRWMQSQLAWRLLLAWMGVAAGLMACDGGDLDGDKDDTDLPVDTDSDPGVDLSSCETQAAPTVVLGKGVGGAFFPLTDGQDVGLSVAPQGGFGVTVLVGTTGLQTTAIGTADFVDMLLETLIGEALVGTFHQTNAPLQCQGDGSGGVIYGVVVGFDPAVYKTSDDLLALDGQVVDLRVTVTDINGGVASVVQSVTIQVGV